MRKKVLLFLIPFLFSGLFQAHSQEISPPKEPEPISLTSEELFVLSKVPLLELPEQYKGPNAPLLPSSVDNSTQPYFRPITTQSGYECGQSAGIAFNFTYEIDRLRNLPANVSTSQYPTHFTWDFLNNANNYQGASFFDSWEIVRACGNMNVADYGGGLNTGGYLRWISGYDVYYNGMKNRVNYVRAIRADNPDGLLTLKYWMSEHLEGSAVGGVGNWYGQYFGTPSTTLPSGTPEAGKYVQTYWGGSPSHSWTPCGYNDSIRYDFNGDGQYTNNLDINGDGTVDMHDWEIGGIKFASGYAGTGWCNQGFCYTMYKNLADNIGYGGIWNHTIYVLDVKETCSPKLTMKITLKHPSRNKLKVTAGLNTDLSATVPNHILEFPIFNYQGGDIYMQGGTTEADKTIEFGLDLTPLLTQINSQQPAKYFLQVQEKDPNNQYSGEIVSWSLIDYTSGSAYPIIYPGSNILLANNSMTRLSIDYTVNFSKPAISTSSLPPAPIYLPYTVQLEATGGSDPYLWDVELMYPESVTPSTFPSVTAQQLTPTNNNTGYAVKTIDFNFPYYKKSVNKLYIYADGYILFDDQPYTYPFLIDKNLLFRQTSIISPFMADLCIYPSQGQGIWYQGDANSATIRWKVSIYGMSGSTNLNFAVKLYANGTIEYYYGDMNYPLSTVWTGGISSGDNKNYQYSGLNGSSTLTANTLDQFSTTGYPVEMQVSEEGLFSGTPTKPYMNLPIRFRVTDNNNISSIKELLFNIYGLYVDYTVTSGNDTIIEYGETAYLDLMVTNLSNQPANNITIMISESDPFINLLTSMVSIPVIGGGQTLNILNALSFQVSPNVPDNHPFTLTMNLTSPQQNSQADISLVAFSPVFNVTRVELPDGDNGQLDPGESSDLMVTLKNQGGAKASDIHAQLSSSDPFITFNVNSGDIVFLEPDSSITLTYHVTASGTAPFEHLYKVNVNLSSLNGYYSSDSLFLFSGEIIEDFETGDYNKFPWYFSGPIPWQIDPDIKYEGNYAGRSGWISDNWETILNLSVLVLEDGEISFMKKVSCEPDPSGNKNYDYMSFSIDNYEMGRWDGEIDWSSESYTISEGYHNLVWVYHKNGSGYSGYDAVFLDNIRFPVIEGAIPQIYALPGIFQKSLDPGQTTSDSMHVTNLGGGNMQYSVVVYDTTGNKKALSLTDNLSGSYLECNATGFVPGQDFTWIFTLRNFGNDNEYIRYLKIDLPVEVTVTSATNFSGGSLGDLIFLGNTGTGTTLEWTGEGSGGTGVIKPGEMATSTITGTIAKSVMNHVFLVYNIQGDSIGAVPHNIPGHIRITNEGLPNSWLTLSENTGSLLHNESGTVQLNFSSGTLTPGNYACKIITNDGNNNKIIIPVELLVTEPISTGPGNKKFLTGFYGNYPNPFRGITEFRYQLAQQTPVSLIIYNSQGVTVKTISYEMQSSGFHTFTWDATDDGGNPVPAGIYSCQMKTPDYVGSQKMILIR